MTALRPIGILTELCDVCGKPLKYNQQLGKKKSNDALCHKDCLIIKKRRLINATT